MERFPELFDFPFFFLSYLSQKLPDTQGRVESSVLLHILNKRFRPIHSGGHVTQCLPRPVKSREKLYYVLLFLALLL